LVLRRALILILISFLFGIVGELRIFVVEQGAFDRRMA
jgi:hypothetical protein